MVNWSEVVSGSFSTAGRYVENNAETLVAVGFFVLLAYAGFRLLSTARNKLGI